ncbi:MAG: hypothetical protein AB7L09_01640 [Nitrospira sp.]
MSDHDVYAVNVDEINDSIDPIARFHKLVCLALKSRGNTRVIGDLDFVRADFHGPEHMILIREGWEIRVYYRSGFVRELAYRWLLNNRGQVEMLSRRELIEPGLKILERELVLDGIAQL